MKNSSLKLRLSLLLGSFLLTFCLMAQPNLDEGKVIFKNNCASCHAKNMKDKLTGPALGGVQERWESQEELYQWIRNSQAMINDGHPRAVELWNEWKPTVMTAFPNLTDQEMENILAYIDGVYKGTYGAPKVAAVGATGGPTEKESDNTLLYVTVFLILGILAVVLARIISNLNHMAMVREGNAPAQRRSLAQILTSKGVIAFLLFSLIVWGGYTTVNNAINLGRSQGYQPEQPIKFSHATHAGIQKIECQYCHDGARRSKHSIIPATNTCMNCHSAVKYGSQYGTGEISKIYASIGWDPNDGKYIENYDDYSEDQIKEVFTKWIGDQYLEKNEEVTAMDAEGQKLINNQWEDIKESLTNDQKEKIQGPIEWVRLHNLPDHAYFNHAQHVSVGKVECQQCHGPVEKMEVVQQYSPLSMGWCINCHRQTEVNFASNDYYQSYELYHKELKNGERDAVTVEDVGGLECQKCHY